MPGRFKDYIANRKANGYQSIHTTVYGPKGPIEFQIRTKEMHEVAEYGVAAHWAYKKGIKGQVNSKESAIGMNWIKEMMELQDQADDAKEFVDSVKENYLAEEIYVFTPDGAVRSLPKDSGPIDFAYEIHTKVGEKRLVPRSMAVWFHWQPSSRQEIRLKLLPTELLWAEPWLAQYGQD